MSKRNIYLDSDRLNPFTRKVKKICIEQGVCNVLCQDNVIRPVRWVDLDFEAGYSKENNPSFFSDMNGEPKYSSFSWRNDGSSINSSRFDMWEIIS